ncbi:hypothetical protein [Natronorubrum sulfidifaciens]|uniref:Uncharacterized protein n=1 Tax=Natronorubrum sulfidifaciens JCM 14089 TaxID=1230460 RepID=L9VVH0_9EURY|nr:hypothetical protein [Natronorubrum sulfidifaciens]ELY41175.1 hypothetical protein C495_16800 [Natronorubrum sulfidifaciens JCM 14089]
MSKEFDSVNELIKEQHGHMPSLEDQKTLYHRMSADDVVSTSDTRLRTTQVEDEYDHYLEHQTTGVLGNLEDLNVVEKFEPSGGRSFIWNERTDEMFFTPEADGFAESFKEEQSRLIDDLEPRPTDDSAETIEAAADDGRLTRREVVADELSVPESRVKQTLTGPRDLVDQMDLFDGAVQAIESHDDVKKGSNYGAMGWRNRANRWAVSEYAVMLDS